MNHRTIRSAPLGATPAERHQRAVTQQLQSLARAPLTQAIFVERITLTAGIRKEIPHRLGRALTGWMAARPDAPVVPFETSASRDAVTLESPANVSFDLWVW